MYRLDVIQPPGQIILEQYRNEEMRNEANRIANRNVFFRCHSERSEHDSTSASD
jgi:hypothetical protein